METQKFEHNGHTYWINYSFDCDSIGVIYLLKCARCFKVYVGSTIGQGIRHELASTCMRIFLARNTRAWPISELLLLTKQI